MGKIVCGEHILAAAAWGKQQNKTKSKKYECKMQSSPKNRVARLLCDAHEVWQQRESFYFLAGAKRGPHPGWHATFNAYKWHLSFQKRTFNELSATLAPHTHRHTLRVIFGKRKKKSNAIYMRG